MSFNTSNIAIPIATADGGAGLLATLATQMFENYSQQMGDAVINKNFALAWLKSKAEKEVVGGLDFAEPIMKSDNTNIGFRNKFAQISADYQNPTDAFRFAPVVLDGTIPINIVHELQNTGKPMIKKFLETLQKQTVTTVSNKLNGALWNSAPVTDVDPESILSIVSSTPNTGTLGGVDRAANVWARNKVNSTTISSVGSAAGIQSLFQAYAELGGAANDTADFAVTTTSIYGAIYGFYAATQRQLTAHDSMVKIGIKSIELFPGCELGYDGNAGLATDGSTSACPAQNMFYLNSNHLKYKILAGGNTKFTPFELRDNSLNKTSIFYHIYNLTTDQPSALGRLTAITG